MYGLCNLKVLSIDSDIKTQLIQMWENRIDTDCSFSVHEIEDFGETSNESDSKPEASKLVLIPAHKLILKAASVVFESMFKESWERDKPIEIPREISAKIFKKFIRSLYTNEIDFESIEESILLYKLAHQYQTKDTLHMAANQLITNCKDNAENIIKIILNTWIYNDILLQEACRKGLATFGIAILENENFIKLPTEVINILCTLDALNIDSEFQLVQALERYIDYHEKKGINIKDSLAAAISSLRFLTLTEDEIKSISFLKDSEKEILIEERALKSKKFLLNQNPRKKCGLFTIITAFPNKPDLHLSDSSFNDIADMMFQD